MYLDAINIQGAISQLTNLLVAGLVLLVGFLVVRHLVKHSVIGIIVGVVLGALVWMVLKTNLIADAGQTIQGWLGI